MYLSRTLLMIDCGTFLESCRDCKQDLTVDALLSLTPRTKVFINNSTFSLTTKLLIFYATATDLLKTSRIYLQVPYHLKI